MKSSRMVLLATVLSSSLYSCQKEYMLTDLNTLPDNNPTTIDNPGDESKASYQPVSSASSWKYVDSATGTITTQTCTGKDEIIDGRDFTTFVNKNGNRSDTVFYSRDSINYFLQQTVTNGTLGGSFLFHYLNDTVPVGGSWEYMAGSGNGFDAYIKTTILEKDITYTVNNDVYKRVAHTSLQMSYDVAGTIIPVGTYDMYIARGVGIIKQRAIGEGLATGTRTASELVEYSIR